MSGISSFIDRFNLVKNIPVFSRLNWFDLQKIASKAIIIQYKKGDVIYREGVPPDFFYCLVSGRLQSYTVSVDGDRKNVNFIYRGMYFGIISLLTGENHSLNFEAINDSIILQIPKDDFKVVLDTVPRLGVEFSKVLSRRMRRKIKGGKAVFESSIISIYSPVKGAGSSMYAVNLAVKLGKETGKNVILVKIQSDQMRPSRVGGKAGSSCGQDTASVISEECFVNLNEVVDDCDKMMSAIVKGGQEADVLHVNFDPGNDSSRFQISPFVTVLADDYRYVIVDLPNEMDRVVSEILTQSDVVHLIALDREKDLIMASRVASQLEIAIKGNPPKEKIRIIVRAFHAGDHLSFEKINKFINYDIYALLPFIHSPSAVVVLNPESLVSFNGSRNVEYDKIITRIAREVGNVRVGLVLGAGAALGIAHIGVIRVLEEEGIPVDIIAGSSMGALIGSLWVTGKNADEMERISREFEKKLKLFKLMDFVFPVSGFIGGRAIKKWLKKKLGNKTFYNAKVEFKVVAYDLMRREELVINSGSLVEAVRKSISIPGIVEPVKKRGQLIIDGGVLNPLPTNVLAADGIRKIISVNVLQSPIDVSKGLDMAQASIKEKERKSFLASPVYFLTFRFFRMISGVFKPNISEIISLAFQASEYIISEKSSQQADITIHPDLADINWFDLYRAKDLIKRGEDATRKLLPEIKKLIKE